MRLSFRTVLPAALISAWFSLSASAQMFVPGTFQVSDTGAAVYTVPIEVPPGTAGMQPSLSLQYNSRNGNGLLGIGWSLTGLPAITRCARTVAQDGVRGRVNYDSNDRFCLDGQRLIAINGTYGADGTQYGTEIEGFSKIISHGAAGMGPARFEVHTKAGQVMEFGNTPDSQVLAQGKSSIRLWAVDKVSDTSGNFFSITYNQDAANGQYQPTRIDYTGNAATGAEPFASVQFNYASRPDVLVAYQAGSLIRTSVTLSNIQTYVGATLVRDYRLVYSPTVDTQRSRLTSIAACQGGSCLPAIQFTWSAVPASPFANMQIATNLSGSGWNSPGFTYVDVNGDGCADLVNTTSTAIQTVLSNCNGTFQQAASTSYPGGQGWNAPGQFTYADINGDGCADLVFTTNTSIQTVLSNCDGTYQSSYRTSYPGGSGWAALGQPTPSLYVDVNGDGCADLVYTSGVAIQTVLSNCDGTFQSSYQTSYPGGSGWNAAGQATYADVNGDGCADLVFTASTAVQTVLSNCDGTFQSSYQTSYPGGQGWAGFGQPTPPDYADVNGDGCADLIYTSSTNIQTVLSKCDGTFASSYQTSYPGARGWAQAGLAKYVDINGDGCADLVFAEDTGPQAVLSNCDGTFQSSYSSAAPGGTGWGTVGSFVYADDRGIGQADYIYQGGNSVTVVPTNPTGNRLVSISNGLGGSTHISYAPLSSGGTLYAKGHNGVYPYENLQGALYVVSQVSTSNGTGGAYTSSYNYAGAKLDLSGRGFLGFRQLTASDAQTGISTVTSYRQYFPYTGLVDTRTKALGTQTLNSTSNTYWCLNMSGQGNCPSGNIGERYDVALTQSIEQSWDLNGAALPTVTTTNDPGPYGNNLQVGVSTSDGYTKTTTNTYTNDTTNWFLGRLTGSTVTSTAP